MKLIKNMKILLERENLKNNHEISKTGKNIEKHEKYQTHEKTSKISKL